MEIERSEYQNERVKNNIIMLDLITGQCDTQRGDEPDDARYYIYEDICKNTINDDNFIVYVDLYSRLLDNYEPLQDDGQILFNTVPG